MSAEKHADFPWTELFEPIGITKATWKEIAAGHLSVRPIYVGPIGPCSNRLPLHALRKMESETNCS